MRADFMGLSHNKILQSSNEHTGMKNIKGTSPLMNGKTQY